MNNKVPMTPQGQRQLQELLKRLKTTDLSEAIRALEEARSHGDLSENAEYDIAKERHQQLTKQISDMERALANAQVIDPATLTQDRVAFGARVTLRDLDSAETSQYQIVGIYEVDIQNGRISVESPIARALIGKESGDEVQVQTPRGTRLFEVLKVQYV
ncbi:MAG: transcription elongation factor GreA [Deltaproteobacteria bacterium]|nr:transcription elongation factor GreA [Deltaproteobacteria bacterium]